MLTNTSQLLIFYMWESMLIWFYSGLLIPFISSSHNESSILRAGVFNSFHGQAYFSFITPWGKIGGLVWSLPQDWPVPVSPWQNSPKIRERLLSSAQETTCHLLHKDGERHLPTMKKKNTTHFYNSNFIKVHI